jgi:prepilin-type N-terminal cleavage/methylation domain-containing protein/prepilin-type processing-associated H-X9-DG protein
MTRPSQVTVRHQVGGSRPRYRASNQGFTLLELLTVIAIMVILMALIFPVFKSLREGNQIMACTSRLQRIGQGLKLYYLDEHGVPPYYLDPASASGSLDTATPIGTGLAGLLTGDYLTDRNALHCPRAVMVFASDPLYLHSYDGRDTTVETDSTAYGTFNQYKYLSTRGVLSSDPDYYRQLTACAPAGTGQSYPQPPTTPDLNWQPDDQTVVTWCDYHADTYTRGGDGQYNVLFWDGSVVCIPEAVMRDTGHTMPPAAAWRIKEQN